jgi:hypothetical protein
MNLTAMATVGVLNDPLTPNYWFPAIYFENDHPLHKEKAPVSINSDNQMPVPAGRPPQRVLFNPYKARKGGQRQVVQPQVVQRWKGMFSD